jgi:hypothetical protein
MRVRARINTNKVNVYKVIEHLERKRLLYSEAIKDIMRDNNISYDKAKQLLNNRLREKALFRF